MLAVKSQKATKSGAAQTHRFFQHRIEHRAKMARRGVDDLQYLGGRGLLLQSLARLGKEPRVLDRDDRLHGEVLQQRDLLFCEGADLLPVDREVAEHHLIFKQRHAKRASRTTEIDDRASVWLALSIGLRIHHIDDVYDPLTCKNPGGSRAGTKLWRVALQIIDIGARHAQRADRVKAFSIINMQHAKGGLAKARRFFEHCVENRREVAGRAVDDLQYLGGRGLLLQRLARFVDQPRILHRNDRLRREILQQRNLLVGERPDLLMVGSNRAEDRVVLNERHHQQGPHTTELDGGLRHWIIG